MRLLRRAPLVSVVVPVHSVEAWLPDCLASLVAQTHTRWEAVVVDDGSPDRSGEIADEWAAHEPRIRVVHTANGGLGAARNEGLRHVRGDYLTFLDSDDVVPPTAYAELVRSLELSGSDFATGSIVRWEADGLHEPPWMRRLHHPTRTGLRVEDHPEILGDVFAWNKLFRRSFWEGAGLRWPEGIRYEDQPTTTRAFLSGRFDVLEAIVYHWRIRTDGTSITQQRASVLDLADRWETKRMSLASVVAHGDESVTDFFVDRVLAGDLWRYFLLVPGCSDEWWELLRSGVAELWGQRSLVHSGLPPVHRLCGWLVEQGRRDDAAALMEWVATLDGPAPRLQDPATGALRLDVPPAVLDTATVDAEALALRPHEV
ncbi:glycosyltransferase family 2 protein [Nocardioides gansuensis]|uniref:Glycosyltransferase family 2 protein n=1 Tax=Nocardioides gansuensis TaxID=2138300 RepID=A0A2T8F9U5_9ACTN|nr:glycosyltransferase family 2 protein [Nocardioides gansuensis]PVG82465.1 glycosyltransferase family 2 protein [Nocardioides gansuensis]